MIAWRWYDMLFWTIGFAAIVYSIVFVIVNTISWAFSPKKKQTQCTPK
jgi:hypothetical protein